jgi:hypothetical protein
MLSHKRSQYSENILKKSFQYLSGRANPTIISYESIAKPDPVNLLILKTCSIKNAGGTNTG